jgi:hypothetical protein
MSINKQSFKKLKARNKTESGIALLTALMALALLTAMGLILMLSTTTETAVSNSYRRTSQAFSAADAGIGLARQALRVELAQKIEANLAATTIVYPSQSTYNQSTNRGTALFNDDQYKNILSNTGLLQTSQTGTIIPGTPVGEALAAANLRKAALNDNGSFKISMSLVADPSGPIVEGRNPPLRINPTSPTSPVIDQPPQRVRMAYLYEIKATGLYGADSAGNNAVAEALTSEKGRVEISINIQSQAGSRRPFSSWGQFFNHSAYAENEWMSGGTYNGPVHTNDYFKFYSGIKYTFVDEVSQSGTTVIGQDKYRYGSNHYDINNTNRPNLEFRSTFQKVATQLAPPTNSDSQKLAVVNGTGDLDRLSTDVVISENLRKTNQTSATISSGTLATGVYIPADSSNNITGGGFYVKGNADDITLSINSSGHQRYAIKQGSTTTTITIECSGDCTSGQTVINKGLPSEKVFNGVPQDRSNPASTQSGVSLYVDGNINGLHSIKNTDGTTQNAIASTTRLSITSAGNITVTGDLKYANRVLNDDGTPAAGWENAKNALGIYTNSGAIKLDPLAIYSNANVDLTIHGSLVAFNEAAWSTNGQTGGRADCTTCQLRKATSKLRIHGGEIYSQDVLWRKGFGSYGSASQDLFFDPRFRNGAMAPPFFPYTLAPSAPSVTVGRATISTTWQRVTQ